MRPPPTSPTTNSTDDDDLRNPDTASASAAAGTASRRPRGRPSGSKNKPKPPIIVTREIPTSLRSTLIEISPGTDLVAAISSLGRRRHRGISVLNATGTVAGVCLRQPSGAAVTLSGQFEIVCLSGLFLPPPSRDEASWVSVFLAGRDGELVGGRVAEGGMTAAGTVTVMAATFASVAVERLPLADGDDDVAAEGTEEGDIPELDLWAAPPPPPPIFN